ncbi:hypothetical protein EXM98_04770 [Clostridium botulinum]|uniref:Uncharacterized protein n=1 Tax=Clostridium botulinum TaxID=1491 RepID=A0ABD7CFL5_CLOBO|nr:hypothetical protein [Clostridium botulinum]KGO12190.1 hypothetical protein NZ45_19170 [Clostridium botulinum]KIN79792.1 hypothetical protein SD74_18905 [Clostridium botulinum]MCC5426411.1 hypothetical protein [Clostridium botulinum]NFC29217.1 hypothetical protein [Clostridium botulinum]NFC60549.1 hypothetical protein [Clostridium botulinum]
MLKKQIVEMVFDEAEEWQEIKEQYERLGYKIIDWNIDYNKKEFYFKSILTEDKKVSFEEAIQAYGKEVYCIWNDGESKTEYRIESPLHGIRDVEFKKDITPEEILNGEWYIKEE